MTTPRSLADLGIEPRLLTREQAAAYCGLSVHGFSEWVRSGRLPGPLLGTIRWDRRAIDAAIDRASGINTSTPYDEWKALRDAGSSQRHP